MPYLTLHIQNPKPGLKPTPGFWQRAPGLQTLDIERQVNNPSITLHTVTSTQLLPTIQWWLTETNTTYEIH